MTIDHAQGVWFSGSGGERAMPSYVVVAVVSFVAAVLFIGYQIWRAWTQRRRWAWVNIGLMLIVLLGTMTLATATERTNTQSSGESLDVIAAVAYVTGMAGAVFWFFGLSGGELIYFLAEHLDKRRTEVSETDQTESAQAYRHT